MFDEIQACPNALTSLKYFCENLPELALCSAGSLLGLHLNDASYPVGNVDMMHLHPMTYVEFLAGIGDDRAAELISNYQRGEPISAVKHQHLWQQLLYYFITGGLPEVVQTFKDNQQNVYEATQQVRQKQEELINAYYADIAKHAGKVNAMHIDRTWRSVPAQLASNYDSSTNRFKFKEVIPGIHRYRQLVNVIDWLEAAERVIRLPIVDTAEQPLNAYTKENRFKLMLFDVGLLGAMNGIDPSLILQSDYGTYKGYFAENFVAQQLLVGASQNIVSWQADRAEVEFLLPHRGQVIPIEVKSGKVTRSLSLKKYRDKYQPSSSVILSANGVGRENDLGVLRLPLYLAEKLSTLISS